MSRGYREEKPQFRSDRLSGETYASKDASIGGCDAVPGNRGSFLLYFLMSRRRALSRKRYFARQAPGTDPYVR